MKSSTWGAIFEHIVSKQWEITKNRGDNGVAILTDKLALEWQRLSELNKHVGYHYCMSRDREHGMRSVKCMYAHYHPIGKK